ncbi:MurR/RpiR family transcriptional regulator [Pseudophaeobacter flagellatus]|uniref:MurR/RpiR family transcriptional regulator n=1 Tax=Pseudophaeobacter flagellatus TaxID=2899119 RepID=UPI001E453147|nr:MurR/RpiR family transcriptional regulator [Pseudophaeobacter flagellatus]MCD9149608.1 MurR/RpiR family transcriptional regulator [Pseudophaeobacter flagellatus]
MSNKTPDPELTAELPVRGRATVADVISELRMHDGSFAAREQKVADFVKAHLETVSEMTIAKVAEGADVSTPTVIRFCRTLGCEGFREFKLRLAQNLAVSHQYLQPSMALGEAGPSDAPLDRVLGALFATMSTMQSQVDPADIATASDQLANCHQLVAAGIGGGSSMLAAEAANRFFRLGIPSVSVNDSYALQMHAATLRQGDVMLMFSSSGEADAVVGAARVARSYGAKTIGITRARSRLTEVCELSIGIDLSEDTDIFKPTASRFAYLAILDALALSVAHQNSDQTRENLRRIRASLTAYHGRTDPQPLGD